MPVEGKVDASAILVRKDCCDLLFQLSLLAFFWPGKIPLARR